MIEYLVICHRDVTYVGAQLEFHPSHKILNALIMSHVKILSHKKEQNFGTFNNLDGLEATILSEIRDRDKMSYDINYMRNLKTTTN